jgi:paraquat-inducible protein B
MTKHISPTAIGIFLVGSFLILVTAIVVVGSGRLFEKPYRFICLFQGNLNGLKVGAPVKVRGVQVGSVAEIRLALTPEEGRLRPGAGALRLPVVIEVDRSQIIGRGGTGAALKEKGFEEWIKRGARAQLNVESLLTGLLYIDIDLHPNTPIDLAIEPGTGIYKEIPTVPTNIEAIQQELTKTLHRFDQIDFEALTKSITEAADSIRDLANSPALKATLESLKQTTPNLNQTILAARATIDNVNSNIGRLVADLRKNSDEANSTMEQVRKTLVGLQSTLDPQSPLAVHLNDALEQLTDTTRSIGELSDYLQRNPAALIRGRYVPAKEK